MFCSFGEKIKKWKCESTVLFYETKSSKSKQGSCPRWVHSSTDMSLNKPYKESSDDDGKSHKESSDDDGKSLSSSSRLSKTWLPSSNDMSQEERDGLSHAQWSRGWRSPESMSITDMASEARGDTRSLSTESERESQKSCIKSSSLTVSFRGPKAWSFSAVLSLSRCVWHLCLAKAVASRCFARYCSLHSRPCSDWRCCLW